MSAVSFSDLVSTKDVLTETKFEPWWETLRSYCMKSLFAISLFMFFTTHVAKPISCISTHRTNITLSNQEYLFINSYCFGELEWSVRYSGIISTTASVFLFMACKSWLLFPSVINAFRIIRQVDDMIGANGLGRTNIERLVFFPRKTKEDKGEIGHACWKIFDRNPGWKSISALYSIRSFVVFVLLVGYVAFFSVLFAQKVEMKKTFACRADNTVKSVVGPEMYLCSNELRLQLRPYEISYAVMSFLMLCSLTPFAYYALSKGHCEIYWQKSAELNSKNPDPAAKSSIKDLQRDHSFIEFFGDHSSRIHTATKTLLKVPSEKSLKSMAEKGLSEAIEHWDRDYIKLFILLHRDGKSHLIAKLKKVKPWEKEGFHEHVFDMPEIFEIAMEEQDFDLVCKLHHSLFFKQDKDVTTPTGIGFEFTGCGCFNKKWWSLANKCRKKTEAINTTRRSTGSHVEQQPLTSGSNAGTSTSTEDKFPLLKYICDKCYDDAFDPVMAEHFLKLAGRDDVKKAIAESVNGDSIVTWLNNKRKTVNEKQRNGWNEMLRVLSQYQVIGPGDIDNLLVGACSNPIGDKTFKTHSSSGHQPHQKPKNSCFSNLQPDSNAATSSSNCSTKNPLFDDESNAY